MVTWEKWVGEWPILKINLSIKECEGHVVKCSFVGRVDTQSILVTVNLFLHVHFIHYIHLSFTQYTQYTAFN